MYVPLLEQVFTLRDLDRTGYVFTMPNVAISGVDVTVDFDRDRKQWHVVQTEGDARWEAWGDTQLEAILALIARRWGLNATFTAIPEASDE